MSQGQYLKNNAKFNRNILTSFKYHDRYVFYIPEIFPWYWTFSIAGYVFDMMQKEHSLDDAIKKEFVTDEHRLLNLKLIKSVYCIIFLNVPWGQSHITWCLIRLLSNPKNPPLLLSQTFFQILLLSLSAMNTWWGSRLEHLVR